MLLDYAQVSAALNLSERTIRKLVSTGALPTVSVGRSRRIRTTDLDQYVENLGDDRRSPGNPCGGAPGGGT